MKRLTELLINIGSYMTGDSHRLLHTAESDTLHFATFFFIW